MYRSGLSQAWAAKPPESSVLDQSAPIRTRVLRVHGPVGEFGAGGQGAGVIGAMGSARRWAGGLVAGPVCLRVSTPPQICRGRCSPVLTAPGRSGTAGLLPRQTPCPSLARMISALRGAVSFREQITRLQGRDRGPNWQATGVRSHERSQPAINADLAAEDAKRAAELEDMARRPKPAGAARWPQIIGDMSDLMRQV